MTLHLILMELRRHPFIAIALASSGFGGIVAGVILMIVLMSSSTDGNPCSSGGGGSNDSNLDTSGKISGTSGEWTKRGSKAYNLAKQIFDSALKLGFNANGAAGVVGNAEAEGASTGSLDLGEEDGSGDGGKGIFQFTPGSAGGGTLEAYESWCKKNHYSPWQSAYVEVKGLMSIKMMSKSKEHADSPSQGASNWYFSCEDGVDNGTLHPKRMPMAEKAYSMFKGDGGSSDGDEQTATSSSGSGSACDQSSGGGDSADGTGSVKEKAGCNSIFDPDHVPSDMKQYIHKPEDVGMHYKSAKGWSDPGNQCVNFSCSFFHAIWHTKQGHVMGNGKDIASGWDHAMGGHGSMSKTPHGGADASTTYSGFTGSMSQYGHTFVVEHVLANGNYIIAEENWPNCNGSHGSGSDVGSSDDWDYALIPKDTPETTFFMPKGSPHWS